MRPNGGVISGGLSPVSTGHPEEDLEDSQDEPPALLSSAVIIEGKFRWRANENLARLKRTICGYRDVELVLAVRNMQIRSSEMYLHP
jgi:hypothetical protein